MAFFEAFWSSSLIQATRYTLLNLARWMVIGVSLVVCLSAILSLNETRNFQARVVNLVGNDDEHARRVMVVLHDIYNNPELYPGDPLLPYASLATELDRLSSIQAMLDGFSEVEAKAADEGQSAAGGRSGRLTGAGETPDRSPSSDQVSTPQPLLGELFELAVDKLQFTVGDLAEILKSRDPNIRTVQSLHQLEQNIAAIARFGASSGTKKPAENGAGKPTPTVNGYEAAVMLESHVNDISVHLAALKQQVSLTAESYLVTEKLDELRLGVDKLEGLPTSNVLSVNEPTGTGAKGQGNAVTIEAAIDDLKARTDHLKSALNQVDQGFGAATAFADMVNRARALSERLSVINVGPDIKYQEKAGVQSMEASAARAAFDEVKGSLATVIEDMRDGLKSRTPVVAIAKAIPQNQDETKEDRYERAHTIMREFEAVGRFQAPLGIIGVDPYQVATMSRETLSILFVLVVGAIGSVIYVTKCNIQHVLQGNWLTDRPRWSIAWYLFRPFFGIVVALAAYLMFKAGQLALGNSGIVSGEGDFNVPILSMIALFAGLLSWQVLEAIETRGANWFSAQMRSDLWATGLENALETVAYSHDQLANNIGRSKDQIFRWLVFRDPVTPELQDRIASWLKRPLNELFSRDLPKRTVLWLAKDFRTHLLLARTPEVGRHEERARLAKLNAEDLEAAAREVYDTLMGDIGLDQTTPQLSEAIDKWWARSAPVPPAIQDRIAAELSYPMTLLFSQNKEVLPPDSDQQDTIVPEEIVPA